MSRILVVDDEPNMVTGLKDNLEFEGYEVDTASDGAQAYEMIKNNTFDLVILDVMMPKMNGFDVCKQLRKEEIEIPIILLTAKGEEIDKVIGLELGADDYIQKPFSIRELLARIKAVLRRSSKSTTNLEIIQVGALSLNFKEYTAEQSGEAIKLSHKEFEIIQYLYQHKNETVDRYDLLENVWGYGENPTTRTVDNFVSKLRQKIEVDPSKPKHILTVHGVGYKLLVS